MMKILHTSDWHLGHTLYGYERKEEHLEMLRQITEIVREEKPDLFLLCGDIFHTAQPSAGINKMFVKAISDIRKAHPEMTIVVIAGNHDSGSRHEVFSVIWEEFGVYTIGTLHQESPEDHIIEVGDKGFVVAVPYIHPRLLPEGFLQGLADMVAERNTKELPVVMTAHTTIRNSRFKGHDDVTEFSVGGIEGIEVSELGTGYDYIALGHIHLAQFVDGDKKRVRYSGTPMAVSFDEDETHSVTIVEIAKHGKELYVSERVIENPRPLVTLPNVGSVTWEKAKELLADYPKENKVYLRLRVEVEDYLSPGANEEATLLLKGKEGRFCLIKTERTSSFKESEISFTVEEFQKQEPMDILRSYVTETGGVFDKELEELFRETLFELEQEKRN